MDRPVCPGCGGRLDVQPPCAGNPWVAIVGASPGIFLPVLVFAVLAVPLVLLLGAWGQCA